MAKRRSKAIVELPEGTRVLITGGGAGIGRSMVALFHAAGARVHTCDIDAVALAECRADYEGVTATEADVSKPEDVARLFGRVEEELGGLDVLVNNVGIAGPTAEVERITIEEWRETMASNIDSQFYTTRLAVPLLKAAGGGSIINISSVAGRLGYALRTPYSASKWAVVGFTKSLAKELGPFDIRVNALLPGPVEGPRIERVLRRRAEAEGVTYEEMVARYTSRASLRRFVKPEDVASMAVYLASPAGRNISGQAISICADLEAI